MRTLNKYSHSPMQRPPHRSVYPFAPRPPRHSCMLHLPRSHTHRYSHLCLSLGLSVSGVPHHRHSPPSCIDPPQRIVIDDRPFIIEYDNCLPTITNYDHELYKSWHFRNSSSPPTSNNNNNTVKWLSSETLSYPPRSFPPSEFLYCCNTYPCYGRIVASGNYLSCMPMH